MRDRILNIRFKKKKNILKIDIDKYCISQVLEHILRNTGCKSTYPSRIQALTEISGYGNIDTCFIVRCGKIKEKKRWRSETIDGNARLLKTVGTKNKTLEKEKKKGEKQVEKWRDGTKNIRGRKEIGKCLKTSMTLGREKRNEVEV